MHSYNKKNKFKYLIAFFTWWLNEKQKLYIQLYCPDHKACPKEGRVHNVIRNDEYLSVNHAESHMWSLSTLNAPKK
jgi:predicted DNA-binding protein YlxM (UPF0122 family)